MKTNYCNIINWKGGVGKTTTAKNLSYELSLLGKKVLMIDYDPQCNLTDGINDQDYNHTVSNLLKLDCNIKECIFPTPYPNLFLIPGDPYLEQTIVDDRGFIKNMRKLQGQYDYVIIDTSPYFNRLTAELPFENNLSIIPSHLEVDSLDGISKTLDEIKGLYDIKFKFKVLFTRIDHLDSTSKDLNDLQNAFEGNCFETVIHHHNYAVKRARTHQIPLSLRYEKASVSIDYKALALELTGGK